MSATTATRTSGVAGTFEVTFSQAPTGTPTITIYTDVARTLVAVATANLVATANPLVWTANYPATLAVGTYYLSISAVYTVGQPAKVNADDTLILTDPTAVVSGDILTLAEAKLYLNITDTTHDAELPAFITALTPIIEDYVGGPVVRRLVTETLPAEGTLFLRHTNVLAVSSVTEYSAGTGTVLTAETSTVAGTYILDRGGMIRRRTSWRTTAWSGDRVTVVYEAGFADADLAAVRKAAGELLRHLWQPTQLGAFGDVPVGTFEGMPNLAKTLLAPFARAGAFA